MGSNGSFHPPWRSTPHRDFGEAACAIAGRIQRWRDSLAFDALGNITASAGRAGTGAVTYTNNRLTAREGASPTSLMPTTTRPDGARPRRRRRTRASIGYQTGCSIPR